MKDQFNEQYAKVFNTDNTIKACGREECKKLIAIAKSLDNTLNFGDPTTGFMNIESLVKFHG